MATNGDPAVRKQLHPAFLLAGLAALLVIGYMGRSVLRFTFEPLNIITGSWYLTIPFFAIRPVLRLHASFKILGLAVLIPLLSFSLLLIAFLIFGGREEIEPLRTLQTGIGTVQLERYDYGGAVGVHGLNLEQLRLIVPGVFLARSIDFYEWARDADLSVEGANRVRVRTIDNYDHVDEQDYSLKSWVYF